MATLTRAVRDRLWHILLVALLVILGLVVYTIIQLGSMRSTQAQQARVVTALSSNLAGAQDQLKAHGYQPSQPPPQQVIAQAGAPGSPGPQGSQGPGPSDEQVAAAVAAYLAQHPIAGQPPTQEQVSAVVAVYMTQHPAPAGSPGPTGAAGPGPSDTQIADAVAVWESGHPVATVTGPSGAAGPQGSQGPPGPSGVGATGPQGSQGEPGPSGASGASGASGEPGQAPSGWTYVDALGVRHTCSPATGTPSPQYSCN
jgi:hypothetical protein